MAYIKAMDRPPDRLGVLLRDAPARHRERIESFWKRPVENPRPKVRLVQGCEPERKRERPFGSEQLQCRHHGATKPPRIRVGKGRPIKRAADVVLRDAMIKAGMIKPTIIKRVAAEVVEMPVAGNMPPDSPSMAMLKRMLSGVR